jgi:plastocyanin
MHLQCDWRRPLALGLVAIGILGLQACGGSPSGAPPIRTGVAPVVSPAAAGSAINIKDNSFDPATLMVKVGTTLTWDWSSSRNPHSVVGQFAGSAVDSGTHTGSGQFQFTFPSAGTFAYQCGIHGASMTGRVVVEA